MSKCLTIAIEGVDAREALMELLAIPGLHGEQSAPAEPGGAHREPGTVIAIAALFSIATSVVTIVDKIIAWRDRWQKDRTRKRLHVLLQDARGNRLLLESATPEQITAALDMLPPS